MIDAYYGDSTEEKLRLKRERNKESARESRKRKKEKAIITKSEITRSDS